MTMGKVALGWFKAGKISWSHLFFFSAGKTLLACVLSPLVCHRSHTSIPFLEIGNQQLIKIDVCCCP